MTAGSGSSRSLSRLTPRAQPATAQSLHHRFDCYKERATTASRRASRGGGKWVAVSPRPGALAVSIGDALAAKRSRGLSIDAAVFQREPGALGQGVLDPDGIVSVHALLCYSDGLVLPLESIATAGETFMRSSPDAALVQVHVDESCDPIVLGGVGAKEAGEGDGRNNGRRGRHENLLGILGSMAASVAVTAAVPAASGAITPAMAFRSAVLMFTASIGGA